MEIFLLIAAGFAAGIVNAIAGGGTFLTFPALVMVGVPPVVANATSAVSVFPGYLASVFGFKEELRQVDRAGLIKSSIVALAGGLTGGLLLLVSSDAVFSAIIPFLLIFATAIFAYQDRIQIWLGNLSLHIPAFGIGGLAVVSIYGGYFNGGLGIVMLALFSLWGMRDLSQMNGLKNWLSTLIAAITVVAFAVAGAVVWKYALVVGAANIAGGYAGARLSRILSACLVRNFIIMIGVLVSIRFLAELF